MAVSAPIGTLVDSEKDASPGDAKPEPVSVAVQLTMMLSLCHVDWSGTVQPIVGSEASRLMITCAELVPPALVAEQVNVIPAVSVVTELDSQPVVELTADSGSVTVHATPTLLVYQPLFPNMPVTLGVMSGGVESVGARTLTV